MMEDGLPVSAQPIKFLTAGKIENLVYLNPETVIRTQNSVIILMNRDERMIERLKEKQPNIQEQRIDLFPNTTSDFTVLRFP
jgi:hypothetical protein